MHITDDAYDEFDDFLDDDFDLRELSRDIYSTEWGNDYYYEKYFTGDSRKRVERRRDLKKLYSQLDEWEGFGDGGVRH
jgi:hypothetical protein